MQLNTALLADIARERQTECGGDFQRLIEAIRKYAPETDRTGEIPDAFWDDIDVRALNLMLVPPRFSDQPVMDSAVGRVALFEDVGYADPGYAIALPGPGLSMPPLTALGSEEQQRFYFSRFQTDKPRWGAFAITEPDVGSDATSLRTTARKSDKGYVLDGTKCFITNGARSDYVVVFATLDRSRGRFGIRAFVVECDTPGFSVVRRESMLGLRGSQLTVLSFEECEVPAENLLWGPHVGRHFDAFSAAQGAWDFMRPMLTSVIVGTCRRIRDALSEQIEGWGHLRGLPLNRRLVGETLASMDRQIAAARLLGWKAAWKYAEGMPMSKDASMAKAYASTTAIRLAETAMSLVGIEATLSNPVLSKAYRDAKAFDILEGTGDMQRLMIAGMHRREPCDFSALIDPAA